MWAGPALVLAPHLNFALERKVKSLERVGAVTGYKSFIHLAFRLKFAYFCHGLANSTGARLNRRGWR